MIQIAPSLLAADFAHLADDIARISTADMLHLDIMDGSFVPNLSFGLPVVEAVSKSTDLFLDVHLMIERPIAYLPQFVQAGADSITIHVEADFPDQLHSSFALLQELKIKRGLALRPNTKPQAILPFLSSVDMILVMTVEPGFGGQSFMEQQLDTIRAVKEMIAQENPNCCIQVDGGINEKTAPLVVEAGAEILVAGSSVFGAEDPNLAISRLKG